MSQPLTAERQRLLQRLQAKAQRSAPQVVAATLRRHGITHVYALGGTPLYETIGACARAGLRVIGVRNQQAGVLMSLAHNYIAGDLRSAVIVSAAPAIANCATGLMCGLANRWPVLVIGGSRSWAVQGGFQAFDSMRFTQPLTKCSIRVETADGLEATLDRAVRTAMEGSPGPVFVDVSESALAGQAGHRDSASAAAAEPARDVRSPDPLAIADAARLLVQARRPVLLIGDAARWADCDAALHRLVEGFGLPFATTPMSRGVVPDDHPLCFNAARGRLLATADFVLAVGARFDWTVRFGTEIAADARIVHVVAQPEDVGAPPRGIELCGDVAGTLCMLLAVLDATAPRGLDVDRGWVDASVARRDAGRCNAVPPEEFGLTPMSPYEWLTEMRDALPREAITVLDGNVVMTAAQRLLPASRPWRRLTPGAAGVMGVGIPFAIGAKLARPDLPVVAIVGDFGFGLSGFELETAARHGVEIVAVVANNAGPGGATRQRAHFPNGHPERSGSYGTDIRHESIARSLGACGTRIDAPGQLGPALLEALAGAAPICLDVVTNEYTALSPSI